MISIRSWLHSRVTRGGSSKNRFNEFVFGKTQGIKTQHFSLKNKQRKLQYNLTPKNSSSKAKRQWTLPRKSTRNRSQDSLRTSVGHNPFCNTCRKQKKLVQVASLSPSGDKRIAQVILVVKNFGLRSIRL